MSVEITLICDCCETVIDSTRTSASFVRAAAQMQGARVNLPGGKDICSWCSSSKQGPGHDHSERMLASRRSPGDRI